MSAQSVRPTAPNGAPKASSSSRTSVTEHNELQEAGLAADVPNIPLRSNDRLRNANNVRLGPASPTALTSMISSFSTHPTANSDLYPDAPPASRPVSFYNQAPFHTAAETDYVYTGSQGTNATSTNNIEEEDELAAEAPVIRTSRPPSSFPSRKPSTSQKTPRFHRPFRGTGVLNTNEGSASSVGKTLYEHPAENSSAVPPDISTHRPESASRSYSISSRSNHKTSNSDLRRTAGPPNAYPVHSARSMRSGSLKNGRGFSSFGTPSVASPQYSAQISRQPSFDEGDEPATVVPTPKSSAPLLESPISTPAPRHNTSRPAPIAPTDEYTISTVPPKPSLEENADVPADILNRSPSFVSTHKPSSGRNQLSERASREQFRSGSNPIKMRLFLEPDDEDDESDVFRRIRELKAAKEKRSLEMSRAMPDDYARDIPLPTSTKGSQIPSSILDAARPVTPLKSIAVPNFSPSLLAESPQQAKLAAASHENNLPTSAGAEAQDTLTPPPIKLQRKPDDASPEGGAKVPSNKQFRGFGKRAGSSKGLTSSPSLEATNVGKPGTYSKSPNTSRPASRSQWRTREHSPSSVARDTPSRAGRPSLTVGETRMSIDSLRAVVDDFLAAPRLSQILIIHGRRVAFSEVGDPNGRAIFCCVGMGMNRFITAFYDDLATSLGLRLVTVDRPGVGDSEPYWDGYKPPLSWPEDIEAICEHLKIHRFSLLAHSAGAIYALATALRLRERVRGKIHLLAPWIPPSQLTNHGLLNELDSRGGSLPRSQRFLRMLPSSVLKLTNTFSNIGIPREAGMSKSSLSQPRLSRKNSELNANASNYASVNPSAAASITSPRPSIMGRRHEPPTAMSAAHSTSMTFSRPASKSANTAPPFSHANTSHPSVNQTIASKTAAPQANGIAKNGPAARTHRRGPAAPSSLFGRSRNNTRPTTPRQDDFTRNAALESHAFSDMGSNPGSTSASPGRSAFVDRQIGTIDPIEENRRYDVVLTPAIWRAANANANPTADLMVCLERKQAIGFRYVDIDAGKGIVIHHGSKDSRIPLDNVKWLVRAMRRTELHVIEGEGHSLMGNAQIIGAVLTQMSQDIPSTSEELMA